MSKSLLVLTLFVFPFLSVGQISNSLLLHYTFDNSNSLDETGVNDGVVYGATPCEDRFGNAGKAMEFANNGYIETPNPDLGTPSQATVSMWLYPDLSVFSGQINTPFTSGGMAIYFNRYNSTGDLLCMMDGSSYNNSNSDEVSVPQNQWFHIAMTNDGTTTKVYLNGALEASFSETFFWDGTVRDLFLGVRGHGNGAPADYYTGKIDDVRIYNIALSDTEIDSVYSVADPTTSINAISNLGSESFSLYPNPVQGQLMINGVEKGNLIRIFNLNSQLILQESNVTSTTNVNVQTLSPGVYSVAIFKDNVFQSSKKFVKQ